MYSYDDMADALNDLEKKPKSFKHTTGTRGNCRNGKNSRSWSFFEIQNLPDLADLPNQLWWSVRLHFTYFSTITYLSEWILHKLVIVIDFNKYYYKNK